MNDVKSLLIATTVLAIGGLGLYMYKNEDSEDLYLDNEHFDDDISDTASDVSSHDSDASSHLEEEDIDDYYTKENKKNSGTRKNNKKNSGTRKKH